MHGKMWRPSLAALLLSSVVWVRDYVHEIFSKLHSVLGAALAVAIYLHIPTQSLWKPSTVYLLAAVCVRVLVWLLRLTQILYRNLRHRKPSSRAIVRPVTYRRPDGTDIPVTDAVHVHVRPPRAWKPRAGQYVYLCLPRASRSSFMQFHPFYASWWYRDLEDNDVVVFIVQKRNGFTRTLFLHANTELRAVTDGPYGKELDLGSYGTVLLLATGIGVAGQLPYVTQILEGYRNSEVKTRRIALFWQMDSECHAAWVADMMMELLRRDTKKILDIRLFVLGNYVSQETSPEDVTYLGERISMTYNAMEAESLITSEIDGRRGHTVVSMCVDDETSDQIRESVRRMLDKNIHLKELDFRPPGHRRLRDVALNEGSKGRVEIV